VNLSVKEFLNLRFHLTSQEKLRKWTGGKKEMGKQAGQEDKKGEEKI